jgi:hypothetical protein
MATVNYSWNLPTVGGSEDTWGTSLNANWTNLDTLLGGVSQTEFAILDGATVSTAELNILDGATVTTAEINQLDADSTGALKVPTGTVAERPTPAQGQIRFNSDDTTFEGYDGTAWGALGGADFSAVAEDIIPDADSTRDLGSSTKAWALAYLDAIEPGGTDTTIKRVGGTNTTPIVEGIAKAWVNFNGTGTIAARDSFNVSSLTDNGTGNYTVNISNAFGAADYAYVGIAGDTTSASASLVQCPFNTAPTASAAQVHVDNSSFNAVDRSFVQSTFHGDLA